MSSDRLDIARHAVGPAQFRLGDYTVEPARNVVKGPDGETALQPKIMDVLCALAARQGEVVTRTELIDSIWGVEFGGDESLTRAISHLRKAFQDTRGEPRYIETISKRGYRLLVPVEAPAETSSETLIASAPKAPDSPRPRIFATVWRPLALVLFVVAAVAGYFGLRDNGNARVVSDRTGILVVVRPFTRDGRADGNDGFSEEMTAALARSPLLHARPDDAGGDAPAGAFRYVLQGDVRTLESGVRVTARLIDAATGNYVWSESYERAGDLSSQAHKAIVGKISQELQFPLLKAVKAKLEQRPVMSLVPWELTLLVTWIPGSESQRWEGPPREDSYWLQRRALELDPDFAPAHALFAQLAAYHALLHPPFNKPEALARASHHAARAVELAPYDAEVLYQIALYHQFLGEREKASAAFQRVLELQPNHPVAGLHLAYVQGHCGGANEVEAIAGLAAADQELSVSNPARWVAQAHLSAIHLARGDYEAAKEAALRSRQIAPMTLTAFTLAAAQAELGEAAAATVVLAPHRREWPEMDPAYFAEEIAPRWCFFGGRTMAAQASFRKLAAAVSAR
jgi:DNA-binding winged helix-turn-helix (wHTH) protein/TolB-like protein